MEPKRPPPGVRERQGWVEATFAVATVWKGPKGPRLVVGSTESSCGFIFEVGREYVVYARAGRAPDLTPRTPQEEADEAAGRKFPPPPSPVPPSALATDLCSRSGLVTDQSRDVAFLEKARPLWSSSRKQ